VNAILWQIFAPAIYRDMRKIGELPNSICMELFNFGAKICLPLATLEGVANRDEGYLFRPDTT